MADEISYKIVVVGEAGTGKTKFIEWYMDGALSTDEYIPTVGIDYKTKQVTIEGKSLKLNIWDTAGEARYRTLVNAYYHGAKGFIILFHVNNEESFASVDSFIETCNENAPEAVKILVGTVADSALDRTITIDTAKEYAARKNMEYFEVSFKEGTNVEESIESMVKQILHKERNSATQQLESKSEPVKEDDQQEARSDIHERVPPSPDSPPSSSNQQINTYTPEGGGFWNFVCQYKKILLLISGVAVALFLRHVLKS